VSTTVEFPSGFERFSKLKLPMAANFKALKGTLAAISLSGASEGCVTQGAAASALLSIGRFGETIDNVGGAARAKSVEVLFHRQVECVRAINDAGTPVTTDDIGKPCYFLDNNTVTADPTGSSIAGIVWGFVDDLVFYEPASRFIPSADDASAVSIDDSASLFTSTDVEGALAELAKNVAMLPIPLTSFVLAADGSPLVAFDDGVADGFDYIEGVAYRFNPTSTDKIATTVAMPPDLDDAEDVLVHCLASRVGAADTTTVLTLEAFFQTAGAAYDADANAGGNTGALAAATTVVSEVTRTIAAADVPAAPCALSLTIVPSAALDADDLRLHAVWLEYTRKNIAG
jgi:hypothetical protein